MYANGDPNGDTVHNAGVNRDSHWLAMDDGVEVYVRTWERAAGGDADPRPDRPVRAVLQLVHGMTEHIHRYDAFAEYMVRRGIDVVGNDHRGHGRTARKAGVRGYFAEKDGFDRVTDDVRAISAWIAARCPGVPIFLLGHSMGSFVVRRYIQRYADAVRGVVIMGTAGDPGLLGALGRGLARLEMWRRGPRQPSRLLTRMAFGGYNRRIAAAKTLFDWLSRDEAAVAEYIADPDCGFIPSAGFYFDLFTGMQLIHDDTLIGRIPKDLPMLFVSGDADPVGGYGKGVQQAIRQYSGHGLQHIESIVYEGGRHEPLHETNKDEVYADIYAWLEARLA